MEYAPTFTETEAKRLLIQHFGVEGSITRLPSYLDQNFLVKASDRKLVLKFANAAEDGVVLAFQHAIMQRLAESGIPAPRPIPPLGQPPGGDCLVRVIGKDGKHHWMHLLCYLPGSFLADVEPHSHKLMHALGHFLGELDQALADLEHAGMHRELEWDLKHAHLAHQHLGAIEDPERRRLVGDLLGRFEAEIEPHLGRLPHSVIHNDANDYNVLVGGDDSDEILGLIDLGDATYTCRVAEVAIAATYAMLDKAEPLEIAQLVVSGYHEASPLTEEELAVIFDLIRTRLCVSLCNSARHAAEAPDNAYIKVTEQSAWKLLRRLAGMHPHFAAMAFREACGLPANPIFDRVTAWLAAKAARFGQVVEGQDRADATVFDFGEGGDDMSEASGPLPEVTRRLFDKMGDGIGFGRYNEQRVIYHSPLFQTEKGAPPRDVHLGIDLFAPAGTPIYAPYAGVVHSLVDNDADLDYGPTLILEHHTDDGDPFYTLYGHLTRDSLGHQVGDEVTKGDVIARIGDHDVNGGWVPHLHFQIVLDMFEKRGDFAGVVAQPHRDLWRRVCPDPNLILQAPALANVDRDRLLQARRRMLGPSLSLSYDDPLHIVQGKGTHLIASDGRAYLDMVNNVCHVGHCHPRVVAAAQAQMAQLNTNTRYLYDGLTDYIGDLLSTFPAPLDTCFLVCTGSEANDLALRMARAYTGGHDVIVVDGAYHGHTHALIELSPYKFNGAGGGGQAEHVQVAAMPDTYRGRYREDHPTPGLAYAQDIVGGIERIHQRDSRLAAFFCESLMGCGGQLVLPPAYLKGAYEAVREAGGICIADEVQVGFGRVGSHFWGFELQGVIPDIVTLGKPIGNGHPMAAVITRRDIAERFANGMEYFNTFGGNPVSCAVGQAVLDVIRDEGLQQHAATMGAKLMTGLRELQTRHALIGDVRGAGLFIGVELSKDRDTREPAPKEAHEIIQRMRRRGILLSVDGPEHNVLKIKPPLVFDQDAWFLENLDAVLRDLPK